jgi:hypothetical protein
MQTAGSDPYVMEHLFRAVWYFTEHTRRQNKRRLDATSLRRNVLDEVRFIAELMKHRGIDIDHAPDRTRELARTRVLRVLERMKSEQ